MWIATQLIRRIGEQGPVIASAYLKPRDASVWASMEVRKWSES